MSPIQLENKNLRLVVDPQQGAGILSFSMLVDGAWLPIMPDTQQPDGDLACASFLMVPYSNRIENGAFSFQGKNHQLQRTADHAIHGDVRKRPWHIAEHSAQQLCCTFLSHEHQDIDWPWAFEVQASYTLSEHSLHMHLQLHNRSDAPMPAGCGWHPYFSRHLQYPGEPVLLQYQVQGAYPDAHGNRMPSGPVQKLTEKQNFLAAKELMPQNFLDTCFYGFHGGHIAWPESGITLRMVASESCTHLVVYNPAGKPYFAIEPVTNANDGLNLLARGDETSGIAVLKSGEVLEADCTLYLERI